jgi:hypothetical protein
VRARSGFAIVQSLLEAGARVLSLPNDLLRQVIRGGETMDADSRSTRAQRLRQALVDYSRSAASVPRICESARACV